MNIFALMKKRLLDNVVLAVAALLAAGTYSYAQTPATPEQRAAVEEEYGVKNVVRKYDTHAEMMADPDRTGGEYFMYSFDDVKLTSAPKGYKPVYISHIGRHGARYAISDPIYENLRKVFMNAHSAGKLTEAGESLRKRYEAFYPSVAHRGGELTHKGQDQLRGIADVMYKSFPEVFKGKTNAEVLCTVTPRVIVSMTSFMDELKGLDKDLTFTLECSKSVMPRIHPTGSMNPYRVKTKIPAAARAQADSLRAARVDVKGFCSKYFNDTDYIEKEYGLWKFELDLRSVIIDFQCLDDVPADRFEDVFTPEELFAIWEVWNFNGYLSMGRSPMTDNKGCLSTAAILNDMIKSADRDLASGDINLSLRFSHDIAILPLVSYMKLDNFGAVLTDPSDVKNWWRSDFVPMASNLQLIFYRSRRTPEILVKVLYNGHEASLPIPQSAPSFYSWTAFKEYYRN
ncbi:MAG TPA: hypothetical protein DDX40_10025 [Rikenellaceae bacterium]|nr:hypothetical protein [Rikenellaceae bacterium]